MDTLLSDLRFTLRTMRRSPLLYVLAIVSLAVGIGANTTIFSAVDVFLLRPLPMPEADRLMQVWSTNPERGWESSSVSVPDYRDWRERSRMLHLAAYQGMSFNLADGSDPERLEGLQVDPDFFAVLGEPPLRGRALAPDDARPGAPPVVMISERLWQRRFGAAPDMIGRTVLLNGTACTVIGIVSARFMFPHQRADVWAPLVPGGTEARNSRFLHVVGRLRTGADEIQAHAELERIAAELAGMYPGENGGMSARVIPLREEMFDETFRTASTIVTVAVLFVLMIACANVANLLLARAATRDHEISIRTVLGAGRTRIARQVLTESVVLALLGAAGGIIVSIWGIRGLTGLMPEWFPMVDRIGLDGRVLAFTILLSVTAGVLFGLAPTLHALRPNLNEALREAGGRGSTLGRRGGRLSRIMVAGEISLALVLLVCAGLLLKGYNRLRSVELGFAIDGIATLRLTLPEQEYPDSTALLRFYDRLREQLAVTPGAERVSGVSILPLTYGSGTYYTVVGAPPVPEDRRPVAQFRNVLPGYFATMDIRLLRGRAILDSDRLGSEPVMVVNEEFVRQNWPDGNALGQRIELSSGPREIVGVVETTYEWGGDNEPPPIMYLPALQRAPRSFTLVAKADDVALMNRAVRERVARVDPRLPLYDVSSMRQVVAEQERGDSIMARLLAIFAGVALLMAVLGVYGVMSYGVAQRVQEVGIRMALGARAGDVQRLIVRQGSTLTVVGVFIGLLLAVAGARFLAAFLYGVSPFDVATFATVVFALAAAALAACYFPARRASRVDPLIALRSG
jgi:predicted permease